MKELKPLPDRIDYIVKTGVSDRDIITKIINTINAGKTSLSLGQFTRCKDGKPLEKPTKEKYGWAEYNTFDSEPSGWLIEEGEDEYYKAIIEYETALSKVLFKGWEIHPDNPKAITVYNKNNLGKFLSFRASTGVSFSGKTIESISHLNLELTQAGEKKLL